MNESLLIVLVITLLLQALGMMVIFATCLVKVPAGTALIRTGMGKAFVSFNSMMAFPFIHQKQWLDLTMKTVEIEKRGKDGWMLKDGKRLTGRFSYNFRVNNNEHDVKGAVHLIGDGTVESKVSPLFEKKFGEAAETIIATSTSADWIENRIKLKEKIIHEIGFDLYGFILDDLSIDRVKVH